MNGLVGGIRKRVANRLDWSSLSEASCATLHWRAEATLERLETGNAISEAGAYLQLCVSCCCCSLSFSLSGLSWQGSVSLTLRQESSIVYPVKKRALISSLFPSFFLKKKKKNKGVK